MAEEDKDAGEKTEDPTEQRREDFRKRGQVAQSKEIASVMMLLGVALAFWMMSRFFLEQVIDLYNQSFGHQLFTSARNGDLLPAAKLAVEKATLLTLPLLAICGLIGAGSSIVQIGFLYNEEALKPNINKINPLEGLKRIFSLKSLFEGLKAVLKVVLVATVAALIVKGDFVKAPQLVGFSIPQIIEYFGAVTLKLVVGVGFLMIVLAAMDFGFQKWDLEKKMRMTKQEVKEELKNREGDPQIKARIRRVQRELANRRMMEDVPKADVIITNPTHIAIALKYDSLSPAPRVIAKGAGHVAEKIKETAREAGIAIVENKPLARTIFKTLKIGQVIPRELYKAVAEVLSYVYKLKKKVVT